MHCGCTIIPADVLEKLSKDKQLSTEERKSFADTAQFDANWRKVRALRTKTTASAQGLLASGAALAAARLSRCAMSLRSALPIWSKSNRRRSVCFETPSSSWKGAPPTTCF